VCYTGKDTPPPLPIIDLKEAVAINSMKPQPDTIRSTTTENVEKAKVVVGRGWEVVRNMNWKDMTKKESESNGSRMWGRVLQATSAARQRMADKYYEVREGGNGNACLNYG
jgi:hypothetical protein